MQKNHDNCGEDGRGDVRRLNIKLVEFKEPEQTEIGIHIHDERSQGVLDEKLRRLFLIRHFNDHRNQA